VLDWANSKYFYTPETQYADLTQLQSLATVRVNVVRVSTKAPNEIAVKVTNPTKQLAFMTRLRVTNGARGENIVPVRWEDNYFALLPGESRIVTASFDEGELTGKNPVVSVEGWNVEPVAEHVATAAKH
jgi:exo-1,4-beta-D-glucosaminidase